MNYSRHLYAVAGILVVLSALSLGAGGKGAARTQPMTVLVTNSTLNPVNTKAVGTTPVTGSVGVSGTVNVAGAVAVNNSAPIAVREDISDRTPVNVSAILDQEDGNSSSFRTIYTVPPGKMFVMLSESVDVEIPIDEKLTGVNLSLSTANCLMLLNYEERDISAVFHAYQGVTNSTYYFSEGTGILFLGSRSSSAGSSSYAIGISGYLVPMPAAGP